MQRWSVLIAVLVCLAATRADGSGHESSEILEEELSGSAAETERVSYPLVVQDTRFFNNQTAERSGPPLQVSLGSPDHYSRIFYSPREGALAGELLEGLKRDDTVLDVGAEAGVFALTAARKGARVTALEADQHLAEHIERSARLNGVSDRALVLNWLASSRSGYATVFGKGARGCTYTAGQTTNLSTEEYTRRVSTVPTRTIDDAIREGMISPPSVVRISAEGSEEFVLAGMQRLLAGEGARAPRAVLVAVYPYQLRRVLQFMQIRGFDATPPIALEDAPPGLDPADARAAAGAWGSARSFGDAELESPALLEFYKHSVYDFFRAQMQGGGITPLAFTFRQRRTSQFRGARLPGAAPAAPRCVGGAGDADSELGTSPEAAREGGGGVAEWTVRWTGAGFRSAHAAPAAGAGGAGPREGGAGAGHEKAGDGDGEAEGLSEELVTLVTAASADYFDRLRNLVGSAHVAEPDLPVLVYDMGLTRAQRREATALPPPPSCSQRACFPGVPARRAVPRRAVLRGWESSAGELARRRLRGGTACGCARTRLSSTLRTCGRLQTTRGRCRWLWMRRGSAPWPGRSAR